MISVQRKMPISYGDVEHSPLVEKASLYGLREFVRVTIDPATAQKLPFPKDYECFKCFLPKKYVTIADRIENFRVRPDDIWAVSFPKSGTNWIINIVSEMVNNLSFSTEFLKQKTLFLEKTMIHQLNEDNKNDAAYVSYLNELEEKLNTFDSETSPRTFMSHLPAHLLPKDIWTVKPKLFYVYRNAEDVATSMFHMFRSHSSLKYQGSLEDFYDVFLNDHVMYGPFFAHVNNFLKLKHLDHIMFINYEEMLADPFTGIKGISEFLGYTYSDDQLKQLMEHVSFENMQNSSQSNLRSFKNGAK